MRTLTPAEKEQCNLSAINCMLKQSRGTALYLVHSSTEQSETGGTGELDTQPVGGREVASRDRVQWQILSSWWSREICMSGCLTASSGTLRKRHIKLTVGDRRAKTGKACRQALVNPHRRKLGQIIKIPYPVQKTTLCSDQKASTTVCVCLYAHVKVGSYRKIGSMCSSH